MEKVRSSSSGAAKRKVWQNKKITTFLCRKAQDTNKIKQIKFQNTFIQTELLLILWWGTHVIADVLVFTKSHRELDLEFQDVPARFGTPIPADGMRAFLVYSEPADGCSTIKSPNMSIPNFTGRWAVLVKRYNCSFEDKVRNAQAAKYDIIIVHNVNSSELEPMSVNNPVGINITAIFVSENTGLILKDNYLYDPDQRYYIKVDDNSPFDINTHLLLPFAMVVGICFCTMLGFMVSMVVKCYKDYVRERRHRLPNSSLKKIPIAKFRKGDPYETCAICLEDFVEEEKLRILPCSHAYHCKCVDPWLTRNRRVCPVCKRKVFAADEVRTNMSDSDSDSEVDDRTPLVRASGNLTQGGTFNRSTGVLSAPRWLLARRHSAADAEGVVAGPSNSAPTIQNPVEVQVVAADITPVASSISSDEATNPFEDCI